MSDSLATLVTARVCQGFGAAAITSVNTTLIRLIYPRRHLGRGMGVNATVVAVSSVAGPTLASGILSIATWPWLFAINIPIGLIACLLSYRFLPKNPVRIRGRHFDWRDGLMNALTFGLLIASIEGYSHGLKPSYIGISVILLVVIGTLFVRSQLHKPYPILLRPAAHPDLLGFGHHLDLLVHRPDARYGRASFYLQKTFGYTEVHTGLILTAWPAIIMVVAPIAGLLVERIHAGAMGGVGLLIMAAGVVLLAFLPEQPHVADIVWRLLLCGLGFGLFQSPNNSILIASAPPERSGSASGMLATARLTGQTTGAALVALLFHIDPENGCHIALLLAGGFALAGSVVSFSRLSLSLPQGLTRSKEKPESRLRHTVLRILPPFPYTQKREKTTPPASLVPGNKIRKCTTNEHINITAFPNTPGHAPH